MRAPVGGSLTSLSDGGASAVPVCTSARVVLFIDVNVSFALDVELVNVSFALDFELVNINVSFSLDVENVVDVNMSFALDVELVVDGNVSFALDFELAETFDPLSSSLCLPACGFAAV